MTQDQAIIALRQKIDYLLDHIKHAADWDDKDEWMADVISTLNDKDIPWGTCGECEYLKEIIESSIRRLSFLLSSISQVPNPDGIMAFRAPTATVYALAQDAVADMEYAVKK